MQLEILGQHTERKVIKSNALIEAKYSFSLMELRTFAYLVTLIKRGDEPNRRYTFEIADLGKIIYEEGKRSGKLYDDVKATLKKLRDKSFWIKNGKREMLVSWIKDPIISENSGAVSFEFYPELRPHLFDLKARFTQYSLMYIAKMKSKYSARIYEALKQYETFGERSFQLDELREMVGLKVYDDRRKVIKDSMKRYPDFRRNVLDVAVEEITEVSDIIISYEPLKEKNRVVSIRFLIEKKVGIDDDLASVDIFSSEQELNAIEKALVEQFFMQPKEAKELYTHALAQISAGAKVSIDERKLSKDDYLWEKIAYCNWYTRVCKKDVRNLVGFLHKAISDNYWTISFERYRNGKRKLRVKKEVQDRVNVLGEQKTALEAAYLNASMLLLKAWVPANPEHALIIMTQVRQSPYTSNFYRPKLSIIENIENSDMLRSQFLKFLYQKEGESSGFKDIYEPYRQQMIDIAKELEILKSSIGKGG